MIKIHHLEVDITQRCTRSCLACNHLVVPWRSFKGGPWDTTPQQVESDLYHLSKVLHSDILGALGGEPTLHPKLVDILHVMRDSQISDTLEVWTHGEIIQRMKPDFWRAFDVLVLSIYEGHEQSNLDWIEKKCEDEGVQLVKKDERLHPNFMTLLEPIPTDYQATKAKFAGCFFRHFSRAVNHGFFYTCCCWGIPAVIQNKPHGTDGIDVINITEDHLRAYLDQVEPLGACYVCAGRDTAQPLVWREERNPILWMKASAGL